MRKNKNNSCTPSMVVLTNISKNFYMMSSSYSKKRYGNITYNIFLFNDSYIIKFTEYRCDRFSSCIMNVIEKFDVIEINYAGRGKFDCVYVYEFRERILKL